MSYVDPIKVYVRMLPMIWLVFAYYAAKSILKHGKFKPPYNAKVLTFQRKCHVYIYWIKLYV